MSRLFALILSLVFLIGCTEPVAVPRLPSGQASPIENILVGRNLERKDIRAIFDTLNDEGNLSEAASFVLELDDAALDILADFADRHLYRSIFHREGLVQTLDRRWRRLPTPSPQISRTLYQLLQFKELGRLAHYGVHFLNPEFHLLWSDPIVPLSTVLTLKEGPLPAPTSEAMLTDLRRLTGERSALEPALTFLKEESLLTNVSRGVRKVSDTFGAQGAAGFASGLGALLRTFPASEEEKERNSLDLFFQIFEATDAPPDKLFTTTRDIFRNNFDLLSTLAEAFGEEGKKVIFDAIAAQALGDLKSFSKEFWVDLAKANKDEPGDAFKKLLRVNRRALGRVLGTESNREKLELFVHSLSLTRWMALAQGDPTKALKLPEFELNFVDDADVTDWAKSLGADENWLKWIQEQNTSGFDKSWSFSFPESNGDVEKVFRSGLLSLSNGRDLTGGTQFIRSVFMTLPLKNAAIPWEELDESENVLALLGQYLKALTPAQLNAVETLLFEKLKIGKLLKERPDIPLLYFEAPKIQERITRLLAAIQTFSLADQRLRKGTPSLVETVHRLIKSVPNDELPGFSKILSLSGRLSLFGLEKKNERWLAKYPGFYRLVGNEKNLAEKLYTVSRWSEKDRKVFAQTLMKVFGSDYETALRLHFDALKWLIEKDPHSLNFVLKNTFGGDPFLTRVEFGWLEEFTQTEFGKIWKALTPHVSIDRLERLLNELSHLQRTGELKALFEKLSYIKNPRLAQLAETCLKWETEGNWRQLIDLGETFLRHIREVPKAPPVFPWVEHEVTSQTP